MFPWNFLRVREENGYPSNHAKISKHLYKEGLKDTIIELENAERIWWNAALSPQRPRAVQQRAELIRLCHSEVTLQSKSNNAENKKRPRDDAASLLVYDEIIID